MMNESKFKVGDKVRMKHGMGKGEVFEVISVGKFWSGRDALGLSGNGGIAVDASQVEHYLENQPAPVAAPEIEDVLAVKNARIEALEALLRRVYALPQIQDMAISIAIEDALNLNEAPAAPQAAAKELEGKVKIIMNGKVRGYLDPENALSMLIDLYGGEEKANAPQEAVTKVQPKFKVGDKVRILFNDEELCQYEAGEHDTVIDVDAEGFYGLSYHDEPSGGNFNHNCVWREDELRPYSD